MSQRYPLASLGLASLGLASLGLASLGLYAVHCGLFNREEIHGA
ncbi:MAG: hypothetical protein ACRCVD_07760 [Halioglobus sp.]